MSISIISDVDVAPGDAKRVLQELQEARAQGAAKPNATATVTKPKTDDTSTEPRRFAGKSREDIMDMYLNLESHSGRLANDLGRTQAAVQELIIDKRARDLRQNGDSKPVTVDPAELLQRPTEALEPFIEERVTRVISPIQQQLTRLEQLLGNSVFQNHHSDAQEITKSPEFESWTRETPLRRSIAQMAANGNIQAADELLSEFKATRKAKTEQTRTQETERLAAASSVSLEQSRTGTDGSAVVAGKRYKRSDIIALMQTPQYETDEGLKMEIQKAYIEGRVV